MLYPILDTGVIDMESLYLNLAFVSHANFRSFGAYQFIGLKCKNIYSGDQFHYPSDPDNWYLKPAGVQLPMEHGIAGAIDQPVTDFLNQY